jgi:hypothetical protein
VLNFPSFTLISLLFYVNSCPEIGYMFRRPITMPISIGGPRIPDDPFLNSYGVSISIWRYVIGLYYNCIIITSSLLIPFHSEPHILCWPVVYYVYVQRPHRVSHYISLCVRGPPSLLSNGYREIFPGRG